MTIRKGLCYLTLLTLPLTAEAGPVSMAWAVRGRVSRVR